MGTGNYERGKGWPIESIGHSALSCAKTSQPIECHLGFGLGWAQESMYCVRFDHLLLLKCTGHSNGVVEMHFMSIVWVLERAESIQTWTYLDVYENVLSCWQKVLSVGSVWMATDGTLCCVVTMQRSSVRTWWTSLVQRWVPRFWRSTKTISPTWLSRPCCGWRWVSRRRFSQHHYYDQWVQAVIYTAADNTCAYVCPYVPL